MFAKPLVANTLSDRTHDDSVASHHGTRDGRIARITVMTAFPAWSDESHGVAVDGAMQPMALQTFAKRSIFLLPQ